MLQEIYETLPVHVRRLVDEVEAHTKIEIQVLTKRLRKSGSVSEVKDENVVGVITGPDSIVIESPGELNDITDEDYIHELLHLRRLYVVNVPHLFPKKTSNGNAAAAIENWLEHIVIYERQIKLCPGFSQKMNLELADFWGKYPFGASGSDLKFNLLSRYMITHKYGAAISKSAMANAIQGAGLPYSIREIGRQCLRLVEDKHQLVVSALRFCEIPSNLFWLRRYDVPNRKAVWFDI